MELKSKNASVSRDIPKNLIWSSGPKLVIIVSELSRRARIMHSVLGINRRTGIS